MSAYYCENDEFVAEWLRNLINAKLIAAGDVDKRSIEDVKPTDLTGYRQCHFFAGIGIWSYALRRSGWDDDRPVWTGSCPCQPFSAAGKGGGVTDERHLWPAWFHLIEYGKPRISPVFGEQVASTDGLAWLDLVQSDMEATGYAVAPLDICAAGVGAPNIRQRIYFMANPMPAGWAERRPSTGSGSAPGSDSLNVVANAASARSLPSPQRGIHCREESTRARHAEPQRYGGVDLLGDPILARLERHPRHEKSAAGRAQEGRSASPAGVPRRLDDAIGDGRRARRDGDHERNEREQPDSGHGNGRMADADGGHASAEGLQRIGQHGFLTENGGAGMLADPSRGQFQEQIGGPEGRDGPPATDAEDRLPGPVNGFWRNADWLRCRDGRWRPVESGTFPLVNGAPGRVGRLRAYGNALNGAQAEAFITVAREVMP